MSDDGGIDVAALLAAADEIVVSDNRNTTISVHRAPEQLAAVRDVLVGLGNWPLNDEPAPIAKVRLNFRLDDRPLGNVGVGRSFLAAHVRGTFLARPSDEATARRLFRALGSPSLETRIAPRR